MKGIYTLSFLSFLSFFLFGCVSIEVPNQSLNWNDPDLIKNKINITTDSFNSKTTITGPICYAQNCRKSTKAGEYGGHISIRGWTNNNEIKYQLYTVLFAPQWLSIDHAYDSKGKKYSLTQINDDSFSCQHQTGCVVQEAVGITFTKNDIVKLSKTGIQLKYYGNGFTSSPWFIPPAYFTALLAATKAIE